jgi:serine/threonine protein kinase
MTQQGAGQTFSASKYKAVAELGRGGMATVFLSVIQGPAGFNKLQVIKRLRPALAADPEFLQMFLEEARLAARINHPNVVQTNEVGFDGQFYFIAMEYLDGQTLEAINRRLRKENRALPLGMHLYILAETLAGLHFAHELTDFDGTPLNVVHRDVSPHNVMVGYDGHVKIVDFGIAKAADSSNDTRTGIMKGKCAYMAPEQFGGMRVDRRSDVFALGVMLWQALTETRLWKGLSDADIFARLSRGEIPTPRSVKPNVPEELERICMRALGQKPDDRYSTAAELQSEIESYIVRANLRINTRDLGAYLTELFAESRVAIKAAIEAQVSKAPSSTESGARVAVAAPSDVPVLWSLVPGSVSDISPAQVAQRSPATQTHSKTLLAQQVVRERRRARLALLGGMATAAVAALVLASTRHPSTPHAAAPAVTSAPTVALPALLRLTVRATPKEAHLFLDDAPLDGNPATGTFGRDGASHNVRAEAPGYVTKRDLAVFDTNSLTLDLALDRDKPKPVGVASPPLRPATPPPAPQATPTHEAEPPPPSSASTSTPTPTTTKPGVRTIDTGDPWAGDSPPKRQ